MIIWVQLNRNKVVIAEGKSDHIPDPSYLDITASHDGFDYVGRKQKPDGSFSAPLPPPPLTEEEQMKKDLLGKDPLTWTEDEYRKATWLNLKKGR